MLRMTAQCLFIVLQSYQDWSGIQIVDAYTLCPKKHPRHFRL